MGIQVRDERHMKALTGLSQAQFDDLLPVFSDIYGVTQQQLYEEGVASGTRKQGRPTADDKALDGDVILAAQAVLTATADDEVIVATENVGHLARFVPAYAWWDIH